MDGWKCSIAAMMGLLVVACSDSPEDIARRAAELQAGGQYQAALGKYRDVLELEPDNAQARLGVAENNIYIGEYSRAQSALERAAESNADPARVQLLRAAILLARQDYDGVIERLDPGSVADAGTAAQLNAAQARAYLEQGRNKLAEEAVEAALSRREDDPRALAVAARLALARDKQDRAGKLLERSLAGEQRLASALLVSAQLAVETGDLSRAIDLLAEASQRPATDLSASLRERFMARGRQIELLLRQDQVAEAKDVLDAMLQQASDHPYANYLAGVIAFREDRVSDAVERLQTTLSKNSGNTPAKALMGAVRLRQQRYAQAIDLLDDVVSTQPDNVPARLRLVSALRETGEDERAIDVLSQGVKRAQDDRRALAALISAASGDVEEVLAKLEPGSGEDEQLPGRRLQLAQALMGAGQVEPAVSMLRSMELGEGSNERLRRRFLTLANLRAGDIEAALDQAKALVADHSDSAGAYNLLGGVYLEADQLDKARSAYERARELKPSEAQPRFNLGLVAAAQGDFDTASTHFDHGLARDPGNIDEVLRFAAIQRRAGHRDGAIEWTRRAVRENPDSPRARLALARLMLGYDKTQQALKATAKALEVAPDDANAHGLRGAALLAAGKPEGAIESFRRARELAPEDPSIRFQLARAQAAGDERAAARETLQELTRARPDYRRAYPALVELQSQAGNHEAALATTQRLRDSDGGEPLGWLLAGRVHQDAGDLEAAEQAYRQAVDAGNTDALEPLVNVRQERGRPEPAQPFEQWVQANPDAQQGRAALADWYLANEAYSDAIRHYEELARQTNRQDPGVLNNLAWLYHEVGDERALATAEAALELAPDSAAVQDTLGWIHFQQGRIQEALNRLKQAADGAREAAEIQYHYGVVLAAAGKTAEARQRLERALELDSDASWAEDAQSRIDEL